MSGGQLSSALAIAGGLLVGYGIRAGLHGAAYWPALVAPGAVALVASFLVLYLPYRAERRSLLRKQAILLEMRDELDGIVADSFKPKEAGQ